MTARFVLLSLLLGTVVMKSYAYDFSAICSTGQTLYYNITDATNHNVALTYPGSNPYSGWSGFTKPTGNITLPSSVGHNGVYYTVTAISNCAFYGCSGLTGSLTIPNSVTTIGNSAFYLCSGFTGSLNLGNSVTSIDNLAFYYCSGFAGNLILPNTLTSIGNQVFACCSGFTSCQIPNSVTAIGTNPFYYCSSLTQITVASGNPVYDSRNNCKAIIQTDINRLIVGCKNTVIPNTVTSIGDYAFGWCTGLTSISIPNSVTSIGNSAFDGCSGLYSISIPNSVTSIGANAFDQTGWYYNQSAGILYLSNCCVGYKGSQPTGTLNLNSGTRLICDHAFSYCSGLTGILNIPSTVTSIGDGAFQGCSGFSGSLTIPNSVISIGVSAFSDCTGLTGNLVIPNSVTIISRDAFYGCTGFSGTLSLSSSLTSIGYRAFSWCSGLTGSLTIPNSVIEIGDNAFYRCYGLTELNTGNSVITIGEMAFYGCSSIESLNISNSVTSIGSGAFYGCTGLTSITALANNPPALADYVFYNVDKDIPVHIPCGSLNAYQLATGWNEFTNLQMDCPSYVINASANPTLGGTVSGAGTFELGQTCTLTAANNSGYTFVNWTKNGAVVSTNASYTFTVTEAGSYVANFILTNYSSQYLTIESLVDNNTITLNIDGCITSTDLTSVSYSRNGTNWTTLYINGTDKTISVTLHQGAKVYFKGIGKQYGNDDDHCRFTSTGDFKVYGNIMSLLYGDNFVSQTEFPAGSSETFDGLFSLCTNLVSADNLVLPATTLASYCYSSMFSNCTALTTAPELPATSLRLGCYSNMFYGCTALTTAPELPATSLVSSCYHYMFCRCTSLNEVTCWATNITASNGTNNWLNGVAATGTFHKVANMTDWPTGASGIPTGWTVVDDCAVKAIIGYGTGTGRWYFISSPVLSNIAPTTVDGMIHETEYDLYRFNQSVELEWENYKVHTQGFVLENGKGYLYASQEDVNIVFKGELDEDVSKEVGLNYDAGKPLAGWNLVGNPFPVSAYANMSYYVMNADGTGIAPTPLSTETAIDPCTGVMVKATTTGQFVTFTKEAKQTPKNGLLQIMVLRNESKGGVSEDKAIVSFNEGDVLDKFFFNAENAQLYISQGHEDYAIAFAEQQGELPLNFKAAKDGDYTITIHSKAVKMEYLHLIDNMTGLDIDMLQTPEYTYTAKATDYASRFRLVFSVSGDKNY